MTKKKAVSLEDTFSKLEAIASTLEGDAVNLEVALSAFEEGIQLSREAQKTLLAAEQKVQLLVNEDNEPVTEPFNDPESE